MKILWVKTDFLHPTTRGGQIRTLEMLRCLHSRHEVHYVAFRSPGDAEGLHRASEYCTRAYPIDFSVPSKTSLRFQAQIFAALFDRVPLAVSRFRSAEMRRTVAELISTIRPDCIVCDFLVPAVNLPSLEGVVLFQHNVESMIWERRVEHARNPIERAYLQLQSARMTRFERDVCRAVGGVIAVSDSDAAIFRERFGIDRTASVPTGVNLDFFARPADLLGSNNDLIFIGSMDWQPNVDGIVDFTRRTLPLIRQSRPDTTLTIAGRDPAAAILDLARQDSRITVTGTVPDVRPYLWRSLVSIVPLRIGGGTRLKIYESMAARVPVVSTRIGAEGIVAGHPAQIRLADDPETFAAECLDLLGHAEARQAMSEAAWTLVHERFSWEQVTQRFEELLAAFSTKAPR